MRELKVIIESCTLPNVRTVESILFNKQYEDLKVNGENILEHNIFLAENLLFNMCYEDFNKLKGMTLEKLYEVYKYLKESGKYDSERLNEILRGDFITVRKRRFIEAIYEHKCVELAKTYILAGNLDLNLVELIVLYGNIDDELLLNLELINSENINERDVEEFRNHLNVEAKKLYSKMKKEEDKKALVTRIEKLNTILDKKYTNIKRPKVKI